MRHLIIGASGQVGGYLWRALQNDPSQESIGTYFSNPVTGQLHLDFTDGSSVNRVLQEEKPDVVWLPAALPDVDRCEKDPDLSYRLNVKAPCQVGDACRDAGVKVVFFSTDYVFDGTKGPYRETDATHPLQVYGRHKVQTEEYLLQKIPHALIIRPAWIYSDDPNPRNFVFRILQQLESGKPVRAATDQVNTPTNSQDLVTRSLDAVLQHREGILHIVGPDRLSRYDLTLKIAEEHGYSKSLIEPITTESLHLPARRPLNGGLISVRDNTRFYGFYDSRGLAVEE